MQTPELSAQHPHQVATKPMGLLRLYTCQPPADRPVGALPPIRVDLVSRGTLKGLLAILEVFFPCRDEDRMIQIDWNGALVELGDGLLPRQLVDASDLIQLMPDFNDWLQAWASSAERGADLGPHWALSRGIDQDSVRRIAESVVKHLAQSFGREIKLNDGRGNEAELRVPPSAQLVAPVNPNLSETKTFAIANKQIVNLYMTRGGTLVIAARPESSGTDSAHAVEINLQMLSQVSVTSSSLVRPIISEDGEEETPE